MLPTEKHAVVVSRQWTRPEIRVDVTADGIAIAMSLPDFLTALAAELGSPAAVMTKAQLSRRIEAAAAAVVEHMKGASVPVMS